MLLSLHLILTVIPIAVFLLLLLWREMPLLKVSFVTLALTTIITVWYWKIFLRVPPALVRRRPW